MSKLSIKKLGVRVADKQILKNFSLDVKSGEVHAIMGPNGSGKSTLANALMGHPAYEITDGQVLLGKKDLLEMSPDERSQAGLFMAFQYPVEVPGVKVQNFLRQAYEARFANQPKKKFKSVLAFRKHLQKLAKKLEVDSDLLKRGLNEGFSGGEKKRLEILQMAVLEPEFAVLDETDSGLDIDAIKAVSAGIKQNIQADNTGVILITHYRRILDYVKPDKIHVVVGGKIVESGGQELAAQLEASGYQKWV